MALHVRCSEPSVLQKPGANQSIHGNRQSSPSSLQASDHPPCTRTMKNNCSGSRPGRPMSLHMHSQLLSHRDPGVVCLLQEPFDCSAGQMILRSSRHELVSSAHVFLAIVSVGRGPGIEDASNFLPEAPFSMQPSSSPS
jgi:hypothetical protein